VSLDLYSIGVDLILNDDINAGVGELIDQFSVLQEAIDKINAGLGLTRSGVTEVTDAAGGMARSWGEAADAAERMAAAADRVHTAGPGGYGGGDDDTSGRNRNAPAAHGASPWDYILFGGLAMHAGKEAVTGPYDQAASIQHQGVLMENQGASQADVQAAIAASQSLQQQLPGLSQESALTIIRDAYSQAVNKDGTRNMSEAITVGSNLANVAYVLQGLGEDDAASQMFGLLRAGDLRGLMNKRNADGSVDFGPMEQFIAAYQVIAQASGGRIGPQDMLTIMKNAGPEGLMMDPHALEVAALLSQNLGASAVGTGINALGIQFLGGKMSQGAAQNLHRAGLLPDYMFDPETGKILNKYKNGIGNVMLPNGALENESEFQQDPFDWIQDTFEPAIAKLDKGSQTALLNAIYADLSRIPGARVVAETLFQAGYLSRQEAGLNSVPDQAQSLANVKGDPTNQAGGVVTAFDALLTTLGSDAMPTTTWQLTEFTKALNSLSDWAKAHPNAGSDLAMTGQTFAEVGAVGMLYGAQRIVAKMMGIGEAGGGAAFAGEGGLLAGGEALAAASGPPGWLVAMTGAVVLELINTGWFSNHAGEFGGPKASRQNLTPTGTPNDPVHVKLHPLNGAPTWMPDGPTGHHPKQSMPMPGQAGQY